MHDTYTLFGFDQETNMLPIIAEDVDIDQVKKVVGDEGVGNYFITPSTREQFPHYNIRHYVLDADGKHRSVAHYEWLARTFSFTLTFPPRGSAIYEEVYGREE